MPRWPSNLWVHPSYLWWDPGPDPFLYPFQQPTYYLWHNRLRTRLDGFIPSKGKFHLNGYCVAGGVLPVLWSLVLAGPHRNEQLGSSAISFWWQMCTVDASTSAGYIICTGGCTGTQVTGEGCDLIAAILQQQFALGVGFLHALDHHIICHGYDCILALPFAKKWLCCRCIWQMYYLDSEASELQGMWLFMPQWLSQPYPFWSASMPGIPSWYGFPHSFFEMH